jgi:hypothetical protein
MSTADWDLLLAISEFLTSTKEMTCSQANATVLEAKIGSEERQRFAR